MANSMNYLPRVAIFLAGIAAGALTSSRRERGGMDPTAVAELKRSLADMGARVAAQESANMARFEKVESRLDEHSAKLSEIPSTAQIVAAMEQLLSRTMASLDQRLTTQATSIEVLKTTVSQTDSLLERVLESLDSLQSYPDTGETPGDPLAIHQATM